MRFREPGQYLCSFIGPESLFIDNVERTKTFIGDTSVISATMTFMFPAGEELWVYRAGLGAIGFLAARRRRQG